MPCLKDISLRETGLIPLNLARSTKAITAYLPLEVSLIIPYFIGGIYKPDQNSQVSSVKKS